MKLVLTLGWVLAACIIHAAENAIVLKANDGQVVKIEPELAQQSETLKEMYQAGLLQKDKAGNAVFDIASFNVKQLRILYELLRFAQQHSLEFPENPTLQDRLTYQEKIEQMAELFKQRYSNKLQYPQIYEIAKFFDIASVVQVIGQLMISPELDISMLEEHKYPLFNKIYTPAFQDDIVYQLKKRMDLAKEQYFANGMTQDHYFKGVSIQDLIDHNRIPLEEENFFRDTSRPIDTMSFINSQINSLVGIENIPNIHDILELNLNQNLIKNLPEYLKLPNLRKLYLAKNMIKSIPENIVGLEQLEWLDLSNNEIRTIPVNIIGLNNLQRLGLRNNAIKDIPVKITGLEKLQSLYLDNNQIQEIPSHITGLNNLRGLSLPKNKIKNIPGNSVGLEQLEWLDLSSNQIQEIPGHIAGLSNLKHLDLDKNMIQRLPKKIEGLPNLQFLYLNNNQIKVLSGIVGLDKLKVLTLNSNKIDTIPENILSLPNLERIVLKNNPVNDDPKQQSILDILYLNLKETRPDIDIGTKY